MMLESVPYVPGYEVFIHDKLDKLYHVVEITRDTREKPWKVPKYSPEEKDTSRDQAADIYSDNLM